jgi:hypothetical protein
MCVLVIFLLAALAALPAAHAQSSGYANLLAALQADAELSSLLDLVVTAGLQDALLDGSREVRGPYGNVGGLGALRHLLLYHQVHILISKVILTNIRCGCR